MAHRLGGAASDILYGLVLHGQHDAAHVCDLLETLNPHVQQQQAGLIETDYLCKTDVQSRC